MRNETIPDHLPQIAAPVSLATERKPVDVPAVIRSLRVELSGAPGTSEARWRLLREADEARAAVAELIEAAENACALFEADGRHGLNVGTLRAALAKVGA